MENLNKMIDMILLLPVVVWLLKWDIQSINKWFI